MSRERYNPDADAVTFIFTCDLNHSPAQVQGEKLFCPFTAKVVGAVGFRGLVGSMFCKSCESKNLRQLGSEICIHLPGLNGLDIPAVFVFPKLSVCVDCGFTEFSIPETELRLLAEGEFAGNWGLDAVPSA